MKKYNKSKKVFAQLSLSLIIVGSVIQAYANTTCPGASCTITGNNVDCSLYREQIITGPMTGRPVPHPGATISTLSAANCKAENPTISGTFEGSTQWQQTWSVTTTWTGSFNAGVKAAVEVPLEGSAEATAGIGVTYSHANQTGGTSTQTLKITQGYTLSPCQQVSIDLLGDWESGSWGINAYVKAYYYPLTPSNSPILTSTCCQASGSGTALQQYHNLAFDTPNYTDCATCN